jgi:methyl-accepting chemotaxis protein
MCFRFEILRLLRKILKGMKKMAIDMQELKDVVEQNTTLSQSLIALATQIADKLDEVADDPAEVRAFAAQIRANNQNMSDWVLANTPTPPSP